MLSQNTIWDVLTKCRFKLCIKWTKPWNCYLWLASAFGAHHYQEHSGFYLFLVSIEYSSIIQVRWVFPQLYAFPYYSLPPYLESFWFSSIILRKTRCAGLRPKICKKNLLRPTSLILQSSVLMTLSTQEAWRVGFPTYRGNQTICLAKGVYKY